MTADEAAALNKRVATVDHLDVPHAWIQWKGTQVCMDVRCACGDSSHVDADFTYFYECPTCGEIWAVGMSVRLHKLTKAEQRLVAEDGGCLVRGQA